MSEKEIISIIVPVYKAKHHLSRCVDSILSQTYPYLEVILVDDGSPDESGKICDEYARIDSRVQVIHQENSGVSAARNAGLAKARGEWISFVDSDDYIDLDMYAYLLELAGRTGAELIQCDAVLETESGRWHRRNFTNNSVAYSNQWEFLASECWGKLYRRNLIIGERFPKEYSLAEDLYFNAHIIPQVSCFCAGHEAKYHYVQTPNSLFRSNSTRENILSCRTVMDRLEKELRENPAVGEYIRMEKLKSILDICSRIVCNHLEGMEDIVTELRSEVRVNIAHILWKGKFVFREKLKFLLVGYFWPLYCIVLPFWKNTHMDARRNIDG